MADRIKIKNIYYMLSYAYQTLREDGYKSIETEDFRNVHDLLAAILIKGVAFQIKRGLNRDYIPQTEPLSNLKGKIDITDSVKMQTIINKQMVCQYDLFIEDTKLNQILKSAMTLLLRHGDVKLENKKALRKLLICFENVSIIEPFQIDWKSVSYHRNNATYKMLINICWLVIKGLLLTTEEGHYKMSKFLDDQQIHRLFEKFVLGYYIKEHQYLSASSSYIEWDLNDDENKLFLPQMKTDTMLEYNGKVLIIDTKYYSHTMQYNSMFSSTTVISNNLYQIFSYVKNKDKLRKGNVSGVLLYAKTDEKITPDCDYIIGGNRIGVKTLDLNTDFALIKEKLDELPNKYLQ